MTFSSTLFSSFLTLGFKRIVIPASLSQKNRQRWCQRGDSSKERVELKQPPKREYSLDGWAVSRQWSRDMMPGKFTNC